MPTQTFEQHVDAFVTDVDLAGRVKHLARAYSESQSTLHDLITFAQEQSEGPARKKAKVAADNNTEDSEPLLTVRDLSFVVPVRKKLTLKVSHQHILGKTPSAIEVTVSCARIKHVCLLPVPEKAVKQFNVCIFYKSDDGDEDACLVFTINEANDQLDALKRTLNEVAGPVYEPRPEDFTSAIPQPHRKHEKAVHAVAHRGSKEGFLFFLEIGILYGFKRPILLIPILDIETVTYSDILQRTFNFTVKRLSADEEGGEEIQFSMIDIANHGRVDGYVRRHGLADASMAASRRAQGKKADETAHQAAAVDSGTGNAHEAEEESEEDADFHDSDSHGGSTIHSDSSDAEEEDADEGGSHDDGPGEGEDDMLL